METDTDDVRKLLGRWPLSPAPILALTGLGGGSPGRSWA